MAATLKIFNPVYFEPKMSFRSCLFSS